VDESGRTVVKGRHLLSVRDLNLSDRIGELIDAGITSFKIEGRLKDIGYIKNVVSYYRQRIDRALASRPGFCRSSVGESRPDFQPDPSKSFTRGESEYFFDGRRAGVASFDTPKAVGEPLGRIVRVDRGSFTLSGPCDLAPGDGICLLTRNGLAGTNVNEVAGSRIVPNRMEGVVAGAEVFRNFDRRFSLALDRSRTRRVIPVRADAAITPLRVTVRFTDCEGVAAEVTRDGVFEPAKDSRKMSETVAAQLSRSGDTIFDVREVRSEGCDRFVPVSLLAELRREDWSVAAGAARPPCRPCDSARGSIGALSVESPYGRGECYESSGRGVLPRSRGAANCTRTRSGTCDGRASGHAFGLLHSA
jgi:Collagenase and related proteases